MKNLIAWIAVSLALVATVLGAVAVQRPPPPPPAAGSSISAVELASLATRVGVLEQDIAHLRQLVEANQLTTPPPTARELTTTPSDPRTDEAITRLATLEKSLDELRAATRTRPNDLVARPNPRVPLPIDEVTARARDAAATEAQRLEALRDLRMRRLDDGSDARLAVLDDMIRLAQSSKEGDTRADIWRQLSHVTDPRLKGPLLDALAFDKHPSAREEAAETLADYMPDSQVASALRAASQNDAAANVRKQAAKSLLGVR